MTVFVETGHTPSGQPLTHARILHARNRLRASQVKLASASHVAAGIDGDEWNGLETSERWKPFDNMLSGPSDLSDAAWSLSGATVSGGGRLLVEDDQTSVHYVSQAVTFTAGIFIAAVRLRFQERAGALLRLYDGTSFFDVKAFYDKDLTGLQVSSSGSPIAATAVEQDDGTVLMRVVATLAAGTGYVRLHAADDDGLTTYLGEEKAFRVERVSVHEARANAELYLNGQHSVSCCCFTGVNLGSTGCEFELSFSINGGSSWTVIEDWALTNDGANMILFSPRVANALRFRLRDAVEPEVSVIRWGNALEMPSPVFGGVEPFIFRRDVEYRTTYSDTNEILGRTKVRNAQSGDLQWTEVVAQWARDNWSPAQRAFEDEPCFIAWRPETYPNEIGYGRVQSGAVTNAGGRDWMSIVASFMVQAHD